MKRRYLFEQGYRERLWLGGDTTATLRLVRPSDKELLRRGFERLSDEGRYNRFFVRKAALLDSELRYLTEVDQLAHVAMAIVGGPAGGEDQGIAIARAVRLPREPLTYEAAVTVIDAFQGLGLGSLLVRRLIAAVAERGGRRLQFWVLPTNTPMRRLLKHVAPEALFRDEDELLRVDMALPVLDGPAETRPELINS